MKVIGIFLIFCSFSFNAFCANASQEKPTSAKCEILLQGVQKILGSRARYEMAIENGDRSNFTALHSELTEIREELVGLDDDLKCEACFDGKESEIKAKEIKSHLEIFIQACKESKEALINPRGSPSQCNSIRVAHSIFEQQKSEEARDQLCESLEVPSTDIACVFESDGLKYLKSTAQIRYAECSNAKYIIALQKT